MAKEKRVLTLEQVVSNINKKSGYNMAHIGLVSQHCDRIPFTSPRMNYCTYGGLPVGRLIEFYGEEHGGKTTSALDVLANYQQLSDRPSVYLDSENTLDAEWATKLGVDLNKVYVIQPETESAEELFEIVLNMIETGEIGFGVIDSIASMISQQEKEKTVEDRTYAGISMALTQFSKKAEMLCKKMDCTIIGINQLRDDMHSLWAGATRTVGGRAWRHMCSVRMEFRQGDYLDSKWNPIKKSSEHPSGNRVLMTMTKNKTCPPNRRGGYYTIDYANGINYLVDLVEVAFKYNLIQQSGAWYAVIDADTGEIKSEKVNGMANLYDYLSDEENEEVLSFIEDYIDSKI